MVRIEPRRGTFVTRLSRQGSLDLCATRALLESYAVFASYANLGTARFDAMQALVDELERREIPHDVPRLIQIDLEFHAILMEAMSIPMGCACLWTSLNGKMSALILTSLEHHNANIADVAGHS